MKHIYLITCLLLGALGLSAQSLSLLHEVQFDFVTNSLGQVGSSDCWGWTAADGTEYAIIGNHDNVAFVRASDGFKCDSVPAAELQDGYYHRDMVTYGNYCYCVSEMAGTNEGLMIFDLSPLPDSVRFVGSWTDNGALIKSHNIDIDTATGHLYIEGDANSGLDIVSLANPEAPTKVGFIFVPGIHDMHARNDTLWVAEGSSRAFSVYDVTDKGNPNLMGRVASNNFGYCHNIWPSDDGRYFITTEETSFETVKIWDASDMNNITQRGEYLAPNNLAHNVHIMGDLIFISHYTSGVVVVDWSDPDFPVELAAYDTYPSSNSSNFFGCWGAFPYTNNGYVYASNFEGKLFILQWDRNAVNIDEAFDREQLRPYPSVFSQVTNVPFDLDGPARVEIKAYDLQGRQVADILNRDFAGGSHVMAWHAEQVPAGTYLVEVNVAGEKSIHRVIKQ